MSQSESGQIGARELKAMVAQAAGIKRLISSYQQTLHPNNIRGYKNLLGVTVNNFLLRTFPPVDGRGIFINGVLSHSTLETNGVLLGIRFNLLPAEAAIFGAFFETEAYGQRLLRRQKRDEYFQVREARDRQIRSLIDTMERRIPGRGAKVQDEFDVIKKVAVLLARQLVGANPQDAIGLMELVGTQMNLIKEARERNGISEETFTPSES